MKRRLTYIPLLMGCIAAILTVASCANPGGGPDGGPYDETPPVIVGMTAPEGAAKAGSRGTKISIRFSEPIKLDNAQEKVIVSPPQMEQPEINAFGKNVTVELLDTIRPNTTYTIDFSDAITDATEGNPLGMFTYMFTTGKTIDSLEVSGHVLNAEDLEPLKGVLVGLYPADSPDSVFRTQPLTRVGRTDGNGRFCIKGVAEGEYRVVCLKDADQDFRLSMKSELLGWARAHVKPSFFSDLRYDTCWVDTTRWDSIRAVRYTHFLPDDVVVLGFVESDQPRHRLKENRDNNNRLNFFFTAPSTEAPRIEGINFDASVLRMEHSQGYDTLTYWICDTAVVNTDTLQLLMTYDESDDSTGLRTLRTDTLELRARINKARRLKMQAEEEAKWQKDLERRHRKGDYSMETPPPTFVTLESKGKGKLTPLDNIRLTFSEPLATIDPRGVHLKLGSDTSQVLVPYELDSIPGRIRTYEVRAEWQPGQQYYLQIDSACITSVYGNPNNRENMRIQVQKEEDYGTIFISIPDADTTAIVQLLDASGKVVRQHRSEPGGQGGVHADFYYVAPGTYYYRCFLDRNGDGLWTTGNYDRGEMAEEVYYSPVKLEVKANFDFDQVWRLNELPLTEQKPRTMVKQKVDRKKQQSAHEKNVQRLREKGR